MCFVVWALRQPRPRHVTAVVAQRIFFVVQPYPSHSNCHTVIARAIRAPFAAASARSQAPPSSPVSAAFSAAAAAAISSSFPAPVTRQPSGKGSAHVASGSRGSSRTMSKQPPPLSRCGRVRGPVEMALAATRPATSAAAVCQLCRPPVARSWARRSTTRSTKNSPCGRRVE